LRKVVAYFLGLFLLICLAAFLLHPSLLLLSDWLAPVLGSSLYSVVTLTFLLFGDPFVFISLLFTWVFVAFLCGMIIRRRLGAVLVILLVWFTLIPVFGLTLGGLYQGLAIKYTSPVPGSIPSYPTVTTPFAIIPPVPSGLTLNQLIETPILGKALDYAFSIASSSGADAQNAMWNLFNSLAKDFFLKPVIAIISVLVGVEVGKVLEKRIEKKGGFGSLWSSFKKGGIENRTQLTQKIKSLMLASLILTPALVGQVSALTLGDEIYSENLIGILDKNNRAYVGDLFLDTESLIPGIDFSAGQGLGLVAIISQESLLSLVEGFASQFSTSLNEYIGLLPTTFAVVAYVDVPLEQAVLRATPIQQYLSSTYNIDLKQLLTLTVPLEGITHSKLSLIMYRSSSSIESFAKKYLSLFRSRGGFVDLMQATIDNGRLFPGNTQKSADGAIFTAGFVNMDVLAPHLQMVEIPQDLTAVLTPFMEGQILFAGSLSYWNKGSQIYGEDYYFDVLSLLGITEAPNFSLQSDFSSLTVVAPPTIDIGGSTEAPNVKITTSVPLTAEELEKIYDYLEKLGYLIRYKPSNVIDSQDFQVQGSGISLPANIEFTKTVSGSKVSSGKQEIDIKITLANRDTRTMTNVTIDDTSAISKYALGTTIATGQNKTFWAVIAPGETKLFSYTLSQTNPGIYTYLPAKLSYQTGDMKFSEDSNTAEYYSPHSFPLFIPFEVTALVWGTSATLIDYIIPKNGSTIMMVITFALLALIAFEGFRSYQRNMKRKSPVTTT
jgi:hypothetical protein